MRLTESPFPGNARMLRLLYVTPEIAWPLMEGGHLRLWNVLQALQKLGDLDVVVFQPLGKPLAEQVYRNCRRVYPLDGQWLQFTGPQQRSYHNTLGRLTLFAQTFKPFRYLGDDRRWIPKWFARLVRQERYDAIWMAKAMTAVRLDWSDPRRTILDGDNFDCVLNYQLLRNSAWYGAKVFNYLDVVKLAWWERQLPRWFARVARCSEADRLVMPARNVVVIPNGTAISDYLTRKPALRILFVGSLGYAPNQEGMQWFLKNIWPRLRRQLPEVEIDIVGGQPGEWLLNQHGRDGIRVHGFVKDLRPFWESATLSVVPLLAGSGTRLKILESLSYGVPVVTTSIGAYGLELDAEVGVIRADEPEPFAEQCIAMLQDEARNRACGQRGRELVAEHYNWDRIQERIQALVHQVAQQARCAGRCATENSKDVPT
jgi:polysaccharide biosynthesis protein PslH